MIPHIKSGSMGINITQNFRDGSAVSLPRLIVEKRHCRVPSIIPMLGAIALDKDRTFRRTITRETKRSHLIEERSHAGNFEVFGIAIEC